MERFRFWGRLIGTDLSSAEEWPGGFERRQQRQSAKLANRKLNPCCRRCDGGILPLHGDIAQGQPDEFRGGLVAGEMPLEMFLDGHIRRFDWYGGVFPMSWTTT